MRVETMQILATAASLCLWGASCGGEPAKTAAATAEKPDTPRVAMDVEGVLAAARKVLPGPHRVVGSAKLAVTRGGVVVDELEEESLVERGTAGEIHASYGNSRGQGRELVAVGDTVWVRPRHGKFHRRAPSEKGEGLATARDIGDTLAAQLDLVGGGLAVTDAGATTFGGRPAHKLRLGRGRPAAPRATHTGPQAWRDSVTVQALDGELIVDAVSGAVLLGRVTALAGFVRDGSRLEMTLAVTHEVQGVGAVTVAVPSAAESVDTPGRSTEFEDRETLLHGLAPPARKAPTPKGTP